MGFTLEQIQCSDEKMNLRGYTGDTREQKANIRIKGAGWRGENAVGGQSNDLGWELMEDGTYSFHVSEYDQRKYNQNWQQKMQAEYEREIFKDTAEIQGYFVEKEEVHSDGTIELIFQNPYN